MFFFPGFFLLTKLKGNEGSLFEMVVRVVCMDYEMHVPPKIIRHLSSLFTTSSSSRLIRGKQPVGLFNP